MAVILVDLIEGKDTERMTRCPASLVIISESA